MNIYQLKLTQFRSYATRRFDFSHRTSILVGNNAAGKTNVLEAIHLLCTGQAIRAGKIEELVRWGQEVGHIVGLLGTKEEGTIELQVTLTTGSVQGKRTQKRRLLVNGVPRARRTFTQHASCVLFTPDELRLLAGSPSRRRAFLDDILTQADPEYYRSLTAYEKALRRRNKILQLIREGSTTRQALTYWDHVLCKEGEYIRQTREALISFINQTADIEVTRRVHYAASPITEKRLAEYAHKEAGAGHTLIGPHKEDFQIFDEQAPELADARDLSIYGSRGEQRMAILWLKIAQLAYLEEKRNQRPILLLDDIFSELDSHHDELVFDLIGQQQTIIATTDLHPRFDESSMDIMQI